MHELPQNINLFIVKTCKCFSAGIQLSGLRSAVEEVGGAEVGGAGVGVGLVVRGEVETSLYQNTSTLTHWHAEMHVDAQANTALHFTFRNSCGLFLGISQAKHAKF